MFNAFFVDCEGYPESYPFLIQMLENISLNNQNKRQTAKVMHKTKIYKVRFMGEIQCSIEIITRP